jgi:hypothetical protein
MTDFLRAAGFDHRPYRAVKKKRRKAFTVIWPATVYVLHFT